MEFTIEQKQLLFRLARESIREHLFKEKKSIKIDTKQHSIFKLKCGVFVTLTIENQLRGCIGYITSTSPLYKTIQDAAIGAAFNDPRFYSLTETEYEQIEIEISVLSEPFPMKNYDDIIVGVHGLILEESGQRGLLLPQVPIEHGMDREQFLNAICRKTGIPQNLWREKLLNISLFTATVFSEKDLVDENAID